MLKEKQKIILAFCKIGKTSSQVAAHIGAAQSTVYPDLRLLQRLGLLEKREAKKRIGVAAVFKTIATEFTLDDKYERDTDLYAPQYDAALVNVEFIRTGHNIFARAA
jgi:transposase-like protein